MANSCFNCNYFMTCKNTEGYYRPDRKEDCPYYKRDYLNLYIEKIDKRQGSR